MANTIIIKKSNVTGAPSTLTYGEPAWDNINSRLYIGDNATTPVLVNRDMFVFTASRNANIGSDQSLRRNDRTFISTTPYQVPFDGEIYCVTAENANVNPTRTWDLVVEVNAVVQVTLSVPGTGIKAIDDTLSVAVSAGDDVVIFFRNASANISRPSGIVYGRRT